MSQNAVFQNLAIDELVTPGTHTDITPMLTSMAAVSTPSVASSMGIIKCLRIPITSLVTAAAVYTLPSFLFVIDTVFKVTTPYVSGDAGTLTISNGTVDFLSTTAVTSIDAADDIAYASTADTTVIDDTAANLEIDIAVANTFSAGAGNLFVFYLDLNDLA